MINEWGLILKESTVNSNKINDLIYLFASSCGSEIYGYEIDTFQLLHEISIFFYNSGKCQKGELALSGTLFIHSRSIWRMLTGSVMLDSEIKKKWLNLPKSYSLLVGKHIGTIVYNTLCDTEDKTTKG